MSRVFVYEHFTSTIPNPDPADSLYREGRAMYDAVCEDLRAIPGVEVVGWIKPGECSLGGSALEDTLDPHYRSCEFALVIAPETDGILESFVRRVETLGIPLLGPSSEAVHQTADKFAMSRHWQSVGVPTPPTWLLDRCGDCPFPRVVKPRDGCGSGGIQVVYDDPSFARVVRDFPEPDRWIVQPLRTGFAVSVSFLIGPKTTIALPPAYQFVSPDTHFRYDGGELPIPPALASRAEQLAGRAVRAVPGLCGYVGVDLVLGPEPDGSGDVAIEINPRLTTSYVGQRALADSNLTKSLLDVCSDRVPDPVCWKPGRVRFRPDGGVGDAGV